MTEVAKTTPQISEFILSPLMKNFAEVKTPLQREKAAQGQKAPKLDLKALFDDCFYGAKSEWGLQEDQPPKKEESLFQAKKTICKPKVFCFNPKTLSKQKLRSEFEFGSEQKTSSSTNLKLSPEEMKPSPPEIIDFEEAAYKTPTMKPKPKGQNPVLGSTKTDKFQSTPSVLEYLSSFGELGLGIELEKSRFFSEYEILETIGSGFFGKVLKCRSKSDGEVYAIKYIDNKGRGPLKTKRTMNEIHHLAKMSSGGEDRHDSSRIVRYFTSWVENDGFYIVMEYCKTDLQSIRFQTGRFCEQELISIFRDIATALAKLHQHNIVHLDVKPENILYSFSNCYKLADFGLSRSINPQTGSSNEDITEGDSRYMAAELLNENKSLCKADVFSLGATMYELIVGESLPCNGEEWHRIREGRLEKLERLECYSSGLKSLVRSCMSEDPESRPSAELILKSAVFNEGNRA